MKIVIAGAGAVGTHLARMLSKDEQNVVLIDENIDRLSKLNQELDIMTLGVAPVSIEAQKQAGVENCDLFVAVTPHEGTNITCCIIAKRLGAKLTVARVDSYEYVTDSGKKLFADSGVDHVIYPEKIAGKEIADSVQYSWVRQWWPFDGDLVLLSVKMHDEYNGNVNGDEIGSNQLIGKSLRQIGSGGHQFHVVAISRDGETIIPSGEEKILPNDMVFFMAKKGEIETIRHLSGKDDYPAVKHIVIIGGSKLAVNTDWALPDKMSVKIIEPDEHRCEVLGSQTKDRTLIINGEGYDVDLMEDEGYSGSLDAFIALTNNDEENILSCVAAKNRGVKKTIAMVENMTYLSMAEQLDVGTVFNKKNIAASYIYQHMLKADVTNVKMLTIADADVAEFVVKQGSTVTKKPIREIGIPADVNIGGVVRDGEGMLVSGDTQLREGDRVVVFCTGKTLKKLDKLFK